MLGEFARDSNGEAVGIGGGEGELPVGEAKAALKIFGDPERVFRGKHQSDAFFGAAADGFGDEIGRVAGHSARVPEAEVNVGASVHVREVVPFSRFVQEAQGSD